MIEIRLDIQGPIAVAILDSVMTVGRKLPNGLGREFSIPDDDEEIQQVWIDDLQSRLLDEYGLLVKLLRDEALSDVIHKFEEHEAEAILHAASAIRLAIRNDELSRLNDETLEKGIIDPDILEDAEKRFFFCYIFLADLQIQILHQLDPDCLQMPNNKKNPEED